MTSVLVIEDDLFIRENVAEILELRGFRAIVCDNGIAALASIKRDRPDLVLCDIMMPEMNGLELLAALKTDPTTSTLPFIFMSAKSELKEIEQGKREGADAYICKPFDSEELLDMIQRCLKTSRV